MEEQGEITELLLKWGNGDERALARLTPIVYQMLKQQARYLMSRERQGHTLTPTALVHEAYFRLVDQDRADWRNRGQFLAISSSLMRRILVDHAKALRTQKRTPGEDPAWMEAVISPPPEQLLDIHEALDELAEIDARKGRVVEMKFFGGMTIDEIAGVLDLTSATVERDWAFAKVWLHRRIGEGAPGSI
jgi:RNA polymerase sigma-70 factor, ECF subfamily